MWLSIITPWASAGVPFPEELLRAWSRAATVAGCVGPNAWRVPTHLPKSWKYDGPPFPPIGAPPAYVLRVEKSGWSATSINRAPVAVSILVSLSFFDL